MGIFSFLKKKKGPLPEIPKPDSGDPLNIPPPPSKTHTSELPPLGKPMPPPKAPAPSMDLGKISAPKKSEKKDEPMGMPIFPDLPKEEPKQEVHHEPLMEKKPNMPKPSDELPAFKDIEIPKISMPTSTPSGPPPGMSMPPMPKMGSPTPKPTPAHSPLDDIHPELLRPSGVGVTREHAAAKVNHFMRLEDYQSMRDGIDNTKHNIEHKARINAKLNTIHQKIVTKQKTMQKNMDYMQKKFQWLDAKLR